MNPEYRTETTLSIQTTIAGLTAQLHDAQARIQAVRDAMVIRRDDYDGEQVLQRVRAVLDGERDE